MSSPSTPGEPRLAAEALAGGSPYSIKLPLFEGPLDLLLHLIRLDEVEITEIPIARVAEQYIDYLELMRELDLDVAGEYLLMAATLAWIKSRMLLPPDSVEEEEGIDPRAELVARLLEYKRFKEAAGDLGSRRLLDRDVYPARAPEPPRADESEREIEVGLFELVEAFRQALKRAGPSGAPHEIEVEAVTVHERMIVLMDLLRLNENLEFETILVSEGGRALSRAVVIATFLAVLELTRLAVLRLYQSVSETGVPRGPLHLRRSGDPDTEDWTSRIADVM